MDSKWIFFEKYEDTGKTQKYNIKTKTNPPIKIGVVKWFGRWKQYSFYPEPDTIFEKQCLKDIIAFIENLMLERKKK